MKTAKLESVAMNVCVLVTLGASSPALGQESVIGKWDQNLLTWPAEAEHLILLKNGKVLGFDTGATDPDDPSVCWLFDPTDEADEITAVFDGPVELSNPNLAAHRLDCSAHVTLPDGKVFIAGAADGARTTTLFDPDVYPPGPDSWDEQDIGPSRRFYPTCTVLGNGTVLVTAGRNTFTDEGSNTPAIFDSDKPAHENPPIQWTELTSATYKEANGNCPEPCNPDNDFHLATYPLMYQLGSGKVVYVGSDDGNAGPLLSSKGTRTLNTQAPVGWTTVIDEPNDPIRGGAAAMYRIDPMGPFLIMKAGGRDPSPVTNQVWTIDMSAGTPAWAAVTSMTHPRQKHYLVPLPDGKILAVGGKNANDPPDDFVLEPELYDPVSNSWTRMATTTEGRSQHSTALLLPDGRVVWAGGGVYNARIYRPPYLFLGTRPTITSTTGVVRYGLSFSVNTPEAQQITAVSLIRLGSVTHSTNFDTRFMNLSFAASDASTLCVTPPASGNEAPPGYYMVFVLVNGVPSEAAIVQIVSDCPSGGGGGPTCDADCNANNIGDACELAAGTANDCNVNTILDECDIASQTSQDANANGIPDECDCTVDADCDDLDPCTTDTCVGVLCTWTPAQDVYGDVDGNGTVNLLDLFCVLDGFSDNFDCGGSSQAVDLQPCGGNGIINLFDLFAILKGFADLDCCCDPPPTGECDGYGFPGGQGPVDPSGTIDMLVSGPSSSFPGQTFDVLVFGDEFTNLSAYEVAVDITGGTQGSVYLQALSIDDQRSDYVFNGLSPSEAFNNNDARMANLLTGGGVTSTSPKYLGTFKLKASGNAAGTFTISLRPGLGTLAGDSNGGFFTVTATAGVEIEIIEPGGGL